jgi:hypothetical protein
MLMAGSGFLCKALLELRERGASLLLKRMPATAR